MFQGRVRPDRLPLTEDLQERLQEFQAAANRHTAEVQAQEAVLLTTEVQAHQATALLTAEAIHHQAVQATAQAHQAATAGAVLEVAEATAEAVQEDADKIS